jgi:hypothetical protein
MRILFASIALALSLPIHASADEVRTEVVHFAKGASNARLEGSLRGYGTVVYVLEASAGQLLRVEMKADSGAAYFNLFEPGKLPGQDEALFIGSIAGSRFEGPTPADGNYRIQLYQMRSAARRDDVVRYELEVSIDGDQPASEGDAKVPGTDFHATGTLPCARYAGQPMSRCEFGVVREGAGAAEVTVFWPDGGTRELGFDKGAPTRSNASGELTSTRQADLTVVTIGSERFEIVDAIVEGG